MKETGTKILPKYQRIAGTLELFARNIYSPGSKLPSESQLMEIFRTRRGTVRKSTDVLIEKGLLERRQGIGVFIGHTAQQQAAETYTHSQEIQWPAVEQQASLYKFTPGQLPENEEEVVPYVREMSRRKIEPAHREVGLPLEPAIPIIMQQLHFDGFPENAIEKIVVTVSHLLTQERSIPLSRIELAAQTIIDDARTLRENGVSGDFLRKSLLQPASYYTEPLVIYRQRQAKSTRRGKNKSRWEEKRDISKKPLTAMTAGEIIAELRKETRTPQAVLAGEIPGISPMALNRIEGGKKANLERQVVEVIAQALKDHGIAADDSRFQYLLTDASLGQGTQSIENTLLDFEMEEIPRARKLVQIAIDTGTPAQKIAVDIGKTISDVNGFYSGESVDLSQNSAGSTAPEEVENKQLKEFYKIVNEMRWLRTFAQIQNIPRKRIAGTGLKLLRLAAHKMQNEIVSGHGHLSSYETGHRIPSASNLKEIIEEFGLDLKSKAAQFLLLHSADGDMPPTVNDKPMTIAKLQSCELRELMRYLRRLKGTEQDAVANVVGYHPHVYTNLENGNAKHAISKTAIESFIIWLELNPQKSTLAKVLRHKQKEQETKEKKSLRKRFLKGVLSEQYLFQEHLDQLQPLDLSKQDGELRGRLHTMYAQGASFGEIIEQLIGNEQNLSAFAARAHLSERGLRKIRNGERVPKAETVVNIAGAKGYGPLHSITHDLFGYAEQQAA